MIDELLQQVEKVDKLLGMLPWLSEERNGDEDIDELYVEVKVLLCMIHLLKDSDD